jgi:hypothetical protein
VSEGAKGAEGAEGSVGSKGPTSRAGQWNGQRPYIDDASVAVLNEDAIDILGMRSVRSM